jgi:hypothetical protein
MDTDSQMSALVGRRIHASAASSSDTRNLQEHEPEVVAEYERGARLTLRGSRGRGVQHAVYPWPRQS